MSIVIFTKTQEHPLSLRMELKQWNGLRLQLSTQAKSKPSLDRKIAKLLVHQKRIKERIFSVRANLKIIMLLKILRVAKTSMRVDWRKKAWIGTIRRDRSMISARRIAPQWKESTLSLANLWLSQILPSLKSWVELSNMRQLESSKT